MDIGDIYTLGLGTTEAINGWQRSFTPPDPAAGENFTHTVPGNYWERLISVTFRFTASSTAEARYGSLYFVDGDGNTFTQRPALNGVLASTYATPFFDLSIPVQNPPTQYDGYCNLPDLIMPSGWAWQLAITTGESDDQISGIVYVVQQFPTSGVRQP